MPPILTSTWAPTGMASMQLVRKVRSPNTIAETSGVALQERLLKGVRLGEELGIDYLLVAQRWWGTGAEIEGSTSPRPNATS